MPEITGVVETCLYVEDLDRAARFYKDSLGFRKLDGDERFCVFSVADRQVLLLFRRDATLEPIAIPGGIIPPHDGSGHLHGLLDCRFRATRLGEIARGEENCY